jgi:diacylglycerol kinase (ATP)
MSEITPKDIAFVINPNSGKRRANKILKEVRRVCPECMSIITSSVEQLDSLMQTELKDYKVLIVSGGDGTVNYAANLLAGRKDMSLAIFPTGSGNGFAREFGFKNNIKELFEDVLKHLVIKSDLISINGELCANVSGLGFDAHVAHIFDLGNTRGLFSYIKYIITSIFSFKSFFAKIDHADGLEQGKYMLVTIANTRQFGNNAIIAPEAKPNDEKIDLVLVKNIPIIRYFKFAYRMMTGKLKPNKYIEFIQTESDVKIQTDFKKLHIDGEPKSHDGDVKIGLSDKKLNIIKTRHTDLV